MSESTVNPRDARFTVVTQAGTVVRAWDTSAANASDWFANRVQSLGQPLRLVDACGRVVAERAS